MTVHGVAIIRTFTSSLHTPFTSVPELGAISQPFASGTKQPYSYTGSDESDLMVSVYKANRLQYCQNNSSSDKKISNNWSLEKFKGLLHPTYERVTSSVTQACR